MSALTDFLANPVQFLQSAFSGIVSAVFGVALPQNRTKDLSLEVVRPGDLLVVTLDFYNVGLTPAAGAAPARLSRRGAGDVFMVARFPPQSFGEQAFLEDNPSDPTQGPPVTTRIAGPSQIVLHLPGWSLPLDLTLEALLAALRDGVPLIERAMRVPPPVPDPGQSGEFFGTRGQYTAIEAPYRLTLSHGSSDRWEHALAAVKDKSGKRTELWHTRLSANALARAVWSPDALAQPLPLPPDDDQPFRMSLKRRYRHMIVHSTANPLLAGSGPIAVDRLMLSSQGAWLNVRGQWSTSIGLAEWQHILTGGRDQFARVVIEGRLFKFGHRAVFVELTERKLAMGKAGPQEGKPVAYLLKRMFVAVRQPTKVFGHRHVPFRTVTIKTPKTPDLDLPKNSELFAGAGQDAFWPIPLATPGQDFLFHLVATDWEGREIELRMPLAFIAKPIAEANAAQMASIVAGYNALPESSPRRVRPVAGQTIAYAPPTKSGDTSLETNEMIFGALDATGNPLFLPAMAKAKVDVPAVRKLTGNQAPSTIEFDPDFVKFSGSTIGNMGEVFARLSGSATPVTFSPDKTGGLVAPDFGISGLSRAYGPAGGDASKFATGEFRPADVFKGVKLLGCIDLAGIFADLIGVTPDTAGAAVPGLNIVRTTKPGLGEVFETSYRWTVDAGKLINQLSLTTPGPFSPVGAAAFTIDTVVDAPLSGQPPQFNVTGTLSSFSLTLLPAKDAQLVALHFTSITFKAGSNTKVDVSVIFDKFEFLGPLSFVNKLQEFIPLDGFDDPPYLDLVLPPDPRAGVNVGFTQGIPSIGIGIFTLQNISFSAGFYLPLVGEPANLRFAFCERHQPFILTVSLFGGGGFFAIDIGLDGVRQIEAALEFGAAIALNLGVASGSASIMGGVYYQKSGTGFALSAYFRAAGSLSVLGIITVSVEFYVALNYQSDKGQPHGGKLWGEASVTVKVKILFFSKSVSISIEREFAGSDPTFALTHTPADWSEYCAAFADT